MGADVVDEGVASDVATGGWLAIGVAAPEVVTKFPLSFALDTPLPDNLPRDEIVPVKVPVYILTPGGGTV
jgi:hypothetical protein